MTWADPAVCLAEVAQARPTLHATLMQRMTDVLSRMLNDPATRAALSGAGDDDASVDEEHDDQHLIDPPANPEESQRSESAPLEYLDQDMENQSEGIIYNIFNISIFKIIFYII